MLVGGQGAGRYGRRLSQSRSDSGRYPLFTNVVTSGPTRHKGDLLAVGAVALQVAAHDTGGIILPTPQAFHQAVGAHGVAAVEVSICILSNHNV